jgi:sortase A
MKRKLISIILGLLVVSAAAAYVAAPTNQPPPTNQVANQEVAPASSVVSHSPSPTGVQPALPLKLTIPSIGVDADVEHVGLDSEKRMDVPKNDENVAWYELGTPVGQQGSAVIAGHFDDPQGNPSVFYKLGTLKKDDEIIVETAGGTELVYVVESVAEHPDATFPLQQVFERKDAQRLNLITCSGSFDTTQENYTHRLVVYSVLKE